MEFVYQLAYGVLTIVVFGLGWFLNRTTKRIDELKEELEDTKDKLTSEHNKTKDELNIAKTELAVAKTDLSNLKSKDSDTRTLIQNLASESTKQHDELKDTLHKEISDLRKENSDRSNKYHARLDKLFELVYKGSTEEH